MEHLSNTNLARLTDADLFAYCHPRVLAYLQPRAWELVRDMEMFVGDVTIEVHRRAARVQRPLDQLIEDATVCCYGKRWVALCRAEGTVRQHEAFLAVGHFFNRLIRPFLAVLTPQIFWDEPFVADAVQQAVIAVWRSLPTLQDDGAFVYWCQRILRRTVRKLVMADERYRSAPRSAAVQQSLLEEVDAGFTFPLAEHLSLNAADLIPVLEQCLRSALRRYVIIALYLQQKTLQQVADEVQAPVRAVSQYKAKALRQLRECKGLIEYLHGLLSV